MTPVFASKQLDWASTIGLFLINFGVLDWHAMVFLELRLDPEQFAKVKELHFRDRIKRIQGIVDGSDYTPDHKRRFQEFFVRLNPIRELRNHIAHGHMLFRVEKDGKTPVMTLSLPKDLDSTYEPSARHLEFEELDKARSDLTNLIEEFLALTGWPTKTVLSSGSNQAQNGEKRMNDGRELP